MIALLGAVATTGQATHDQVILALIGLAVALVGILGVSIKGMQHSRAANRAVNDVGSGELKIYEKVTRIDTTVTALGLAQTEFEQKGWAHGLPPDFDTAPGLTDTIRKLQQKDDRNSEEHAVIGEKLDKIEWTLTQKTEES